MLPLIVRLVWTLPILYITFDVCAVPHAAVRVDAARFTAVGVDAAFYTAVRVNAAPYYAVRVDVSYPIYYV